MNQADLERVFDVLEYIRDHDLPNENKGTKLLGVFHHFKLNREELIVIYKYLLGKGYIYENIYGTDDFFREFHESIQLEPHHESRAGMKLDGLNELRDRERRQIEKVLNDSIVKTNETQRRSLRFSGIVSFLALSVSVGAFFNGAPKEMKQQNIILQSQVRVLQSLLQIQKQNQATLVMMAKEDSLRRRK